MEYLNRFDVRWNYKTISLLIFLIFFPNILGMINLTTVYGFKIHFFQLAIFIAALLYGPTAGLLSGLVGSTYSAVIMHNPYLMIGNALIGFFVGLFVRYGINTIISVLLAFLIQIPWLFITDYYLVGLSYSFIFQLILALLVSNIVWAVVAKYSINPIKKSLKC